MIDQQTITLWKAALADAPQTLEAIRLRTALDALEEALQTASQYREAALARYGAENRADRLSGIVARVRTTLGEWQEDLAKHQCHSIPATDYAKGECAGEVKTLELHIATLTMIAGEPTQAPLRFAEGTFSHGPAVAVRR